MSQPTDPIESADVSARLDALIALNVRLLHHLSGQESKKEIGNDAVFLRGFGLKNPTIAAILGSTPGSVAELISKRSQRPKKGPKKNGKAKRTAKNK
jgi:hypothetical protein